MNRLSVEVRAQILHALCEGMSMRSCERVFGRPFGTIKRILEEVGDWAIHFCENQPPVPAEIIQADEMWAFIGENDRGSSKKPEQRSERGVTWLWMAVDKNTKLVLTTHVGSRQTRDATTFMRKLKRRLLHDEQGNLVIKPTIAVDGHKAYVDAIELAFGHEINAGQVIKIYTKSPDPVTGEVPPGARYKESRPNPLVGDPDPMELTTWRIERENGFFRQANRRFTRKTNGFSKDRLFHERSVAVLTIYRNYCWQPYPMRPRDGSRQWQKRETAALAAGLTEKFWTIDDLILASDEFKAGRLASNDNIEPAEEGAREGSFPFWVFHIANKREAKVHKSDCTSCNDGTGKKGSTSTRGEWLGFDSLQDAIAFAASAQPDKFAECRLCLGDYNTLSSYGRRV